MQDTRPTPRHPLAPDTIPAATYARVFEQGDGALILEELVRVFARPAVLEGGIDAVLKTYSQEGSRRVLDFIVRKINKANEVAEIEEAPNV